MAEGSDKGEKYTFKEPAQARWLSIFQTEKYQGKDTERYSVTFIVDPTNADFARMKEVIMRVAKAKWPNRDIGKDWRAGELNMPFKIGNELIAQRIASRTKRGEELDDKLDYLKDKIQIKASSYQAPRLAAILGTGAIELNTDAKVQAHKDKFFPGSLIIPVFYFVAKNAKSSDKKDGIVSYINMLLGTGLGERIGGGEDPNKAFGEYIGKLSTIDPMASLAGELGLTGAGDLRDEIPF